MTQFPTWCHIANQAIGPARLDILTGRATQLHLGVTHAAAVVPSHYASEEHYARVLKKLGKPKAAGLIMTKLPTTKAMRSGDLGEIFVTHWINELSGEYQVPIKRLRWGDHREMAMRGEDAIGFALTPGSNALRFLKVEAKSRVALSTKVVTDARKGLDKDGGLPSPNALTFISARLVEMGETDLADIIDAAVLNTGIQASSVTHLLFTFSANDPTTLLTNSLQGYPGSIAQWAVGLRVSTHAAFVGDIYNQVIFNAHNG